MTTTEKDRATLAEFSAQHPAEWGACGSACLDFRKAQEPSLAYDPNRIAEQRFRLQSVADPDEAKALATEIAANEVVAADLRHPLRFNHRAGMVVAQRKLHAAIEVVIGLGLDFVKEKLAALNAQLAEFYAEHDEPAPIDTPMHARFKRLENTFVQWRFQISQQQVSSAHLYVSIGHFHAIFAPDAVETRPRFRTCTDAVIDRAVRTTVEQAKRDAEEVERRNVERDARIKDGNSRTNARARQAARKNVPWAGAARADEPQPAGVGQEEVTPV